MSFHKLYTASNLPSNGFFRLIILSACSGMQTSGKSSLDKPVLMPVIESGWWQPAAEPGVPGIQPSAPT